MPGTCCNTPARVVIPAASMSFAVTALTASGTTCAFSEIFRAVTVTSSMPPVLAVLAAGAVCAFAWVNAKKPDTTHHAVPPSKYERLILDPP